MAQGRRNRFTHTHTIRFEGAKQTLWIWPDREDDHQPTIIIERIIILDENLPAGVFNKADPFYHVKPRKDGGENDEISQTSADKSISKPRKNWQIKMFIW